MKNTISKSLTLSLLIPLFAFGQESTKSSPFEYIRWKDVAPEVLVRDQWYELVAINDLPIQSILDHCRKLKVERWREFFDEDLVEAMSTMDQPPGPTVALELKELKTGETRRMTDVAMTTANREAIVLANHGDQDESLWIVGAPEIDREHRDAAHVDFVDLTTRVECSKPWAEEILSAKRVAEDLDDLEWHLLNRFAYLKRRPVDFQAALDTMRLELGDGISRGALATQLIKFLALFGDPNTRLNRYSDVNANRMIPWVMFLPPGYTPFMLAYDGDRIVAYSAREKRYLDEAYPYLKTLDDVPIDRWMSVARRIIARASTPFRQQILTRYGMLVGYVRSELGLQDKGTILIELESADRSTTRQFTMPVAANPPMPKRKRPVQFDTRDGNIGYLRISQMPRHPRSIKTVMEAMAAMRETTGLVIDLRDNMGGSREQIRALFPFFMATDEAPFVANVAAARIPPGKDPNLPDGYLADAGLYPVSSRYWNARERLMIEKFQKTFRPKWGRPSAGYSPLHYFVLAPRKSAAYYHYDKPVVVLMNAACLTDTEVLLSAFKGRAGVTLMGEPSGGGDGRAKNIATLLNSGFRVQLSSMVSYQPDGRLYNDNGITPDVIVRPTPTDLIGQTDSVLDAAVKRLR